MESLEIKGNGNNELESNISGTTNHSQSSINIVISNNNNNNREVKVVGNNNNNSISKGESSRCEWLLRVLALVLTLSGAVILGVNKQNKVVAFEIVDTLPPIRIPVTAKWHYLSAFVYFVVANAVACAYAALSLVLALANRGGKSSAVPGLIIFALDAVMVGLLFSANGATTAIGVMGFTGNSHVRWRKVCDVFGKFCNQATVALVVSFLGAIAFLLLVILAAKRLHNK